MWRLIGEVYGGDWVNYGRRVLEQPEETSAFLEVPAMISKGNWIQCVRCEQFSNKREVRLSNGSYFCPHCMELGRVTSGGPLYVIPEASGVLLRNSCTWQGELTSAQQEVSEKIVATINECQKLLIHAVTGAGKTEMLFRGIETALAQGKRVGVVSPRVDVCLELYPRICAAFAGVEVALLYGKSEESYRMTPLVIATTHQLLRFYRAFDVLVVDEVDVFPFSNEDMLEVGVKNALKKQSTLIFLTATPTKKLLDEVKKGRFEQVVLPGRFHQHELVIPKFRWVDRWYSQVKNGKLPKGFLRVMNELLEDSFPFLVFCPSIEWMKMVEELLRERYPARSFTSVSAVDEERIEKVQKMREGSYDFLLTTNILERGVTFSGISVVIFGANHRVFPRSALVQISGRVGRDVARPGGKVYFLHDGKSKAMVAAREEIRKMNRLAKKKGLVV